MYQRIEVRESIIIDGLNPLTTILEPSIITLVLCGFCLRKAQRIADYKF